MVAVRRKTEGRTKHIYIDAPQVQPAVDWASDPISSDEINSATTYLFQKYLVTGQHRSDGRLKNPTITAEGEDKAESGTSVRPGRIEPANTTGTVYNNTINNHGSANIALQSNDFTQKLTIEQKANKILKVAHALDAHASTGPANADEARRIAAGLRQAVPDPKENRTKLQTNLASAIGAFTFAKDATAGQEATQLAVSAIQSLG